MAMNKLLYVLPALAILGLIPAADADKTQERIERLQERIAELQERIEQSTDQKKIAKWEANIDRLQERIAELEARQAKAAQTVTPPQERAARETSDSTPPSVVSAEIHRGTKAITIEFDEVIDISASRFGSILTAVIITSSGSNTQHIIDITTTDDSMIVTGTVRDNDNRLANEDAVVALRLLGGSIADLEGNTNPSNIFNSVDILEPDTTPPSFVSATLDMSDGTLTVVFDETVKISTVNPPGWTFINLDDLLDRPKLEGSQLSTAADSETITVTLSQTTLDWADGKRFVVILNRLTDLAGIPYSGSGGHGHPVTVIPADTTPPVITLVGDDPLAHELGEPYTDPGAGTDDGSAVTTDDSAVDVDVAGDYTVTYTATDEHGNEGTATRTVQVRDTTPPAFSSGTLDVPARTLAVAFGETIDVSETDLARFSLSKDGATSHALGGSTLGSTADSDTVTVTLSQSAVDWIGGEETVSLLLSDGAVEDGAGNGYRTTGSALPLTVVPAPEDTTDGTPGTGDTAPPTVLSATLDLGTGTLAIVFDGAIDLDRVRHDQIEIYDTADPGNNVLDLTHATTQTSDPGTLSVEFSDAYVGHVSGWSNVHLTVLPGSVYDAAGVGIGHVSGMPVTVIPARDGTPTDDTPTEQTPDTGAPACSISNGGNQHWQYTGACGEVTGAGAPIATVTITADGMFENSGTVELAASDLMAFGVDFVNNDDRAYTVLADLISRDSWHAGADIPMPPGTAASVGPFIVDGHMGPGDIAYLVFGAADDPGTPEHEPDTVLGNIFLKIRIIEPAS